MVFVLKEVVGYNFVMCAVVYVCDMCTSKLVVCVVGVPKEEVVV